MANIDQDRGTAVVTGGGTPFKVFTPFFTAQRGTVGRVGLGMSMVHNLVTSALQGTIDIHSREGQGTRVTIKLPDIITEDVAASTAAGS